jgi:hypothetical protein
MEGGLMGRRTFEDSVVNGDLSYWGFWKGLQYAAEGYSPTSTLAQILSGRSDNPGHRVLCLDMKPRAWQINGRLYTHLPMNQIGALTARYCLPVRPDGQPYRATELAEFLEVEPVAYLDCLARGRAAYKALIFSDLALTREAC